MKTSRALLLTLLAFVPGAAMAEVPIQFATVNVRAPDDPNVNGMRFSVLRGRNESVRGVDLGLISVSETSNLVGFSGILGVGRLNGNLRGCATGVVNVHRGRDQGLNAAVVNRVNTVDSGANLGLVNVSDGYAMADVGAVNISDRGTVQVGVVNVTNRIEGVQIGLLNFAKNGFLPMFPFFNFPKN